MQSQVCENCGARSPETQTALTLIGNKHAWRVVREKEQTGHMRFVWRCPPCWSTHRAADLARAAAGATASRSRG
jgi:hypothetical protein